MKARRPLRKVTIARSHLPLLPHSGIDPLFFDFLVALNLQTSFLTPPMAMSAYYLKGIAPPEIELVQIVRAR